MRDTTAMTVRLPRDVRDWLEAEADRNMTSINAELVRSVRERMERQSRATRFTSKDGD